MDIKNRQPKTKKANMKIGITNLKGGVGKTTLSINLAVCLAHRDYRVCVIDTDTNQNSLHWYGARDAGRPQVVVVGTSEAKALTKAADALGKVHDVIIMDGTPNLSEMNTRVMLASDILLVPIRPAANDFRALTEFIERLKQVREIRGALPAYFVINEFDARKVTHGAIRAALRQSYDLPILNTALKSRTAYNEAAINGTGVLEESDPKARNEMETLTTEILTLFNHEQKTA